MLDTGNALVFWCIVLKPFSGNLLRWKDSGLRFWEELVSDKMERIQVRVCKNFACHWIMSLWLWFQWDTIVWWPALLASSPPYIVHIQCTYKAQNCSEVWLCDNLFRLQSRRPFCPCPLNTPSVGLACHCFCLYTCSSICSSTIRIPSLYTARIPYSTLRTTLLYVCFLS